MIRMIAIPIICFVIAIVYGAKNPCTRTYAIAVGLLFIPTISNYYNERQIIYYRLGHHCTDRELYWKDLFQTQIKVSIDY